MLVTAFAVTFYYLGRNGLTGGISVAFITFTILASLSFSRRLGVGFIVVTLVAYVGVGVLAQHHRVTINVAASDPLILRNWIRIGGINALLALLLISVVEFVVRSVEANGRAASEALKWLRTAYDKLETTKEDERRFLSHELHDELGQTLTALKLGLQLAAREEPPPEDKGSPLAQPLTLVDDLITRVRRISLDLRPPLLDEVGLVSALRAYLQSQATVSGLAIELLPRNHRFDCPPSTRSPASASFRSRSRTSSATPAHVGSTSTSMGRPPGCRCRSRMMAAASIPRP